MNLFQILNSFLKIISAIEYKSNGSRLWGKNCFISLKIRINYNGARTRFGRGVLRNDGEEQRGLELKRKSENRV
jgi:hypothetical protein